MAEIVLRVACQSDNISGKEMVKLRDYIVLVYHSRPWNPNSRFSISFISFSFSQE